MNSDGTWHCKCGCGNFIDVPEAWMICGFVKSCGCRKSRAQDLRGKRFGKLVAVEPVETKGPDGSLRWKCHCDCGNETIVSSNKLLQKRTISCGCQQQLAAMSSKTFVDGTCLEILFSPKIRTNNSSGHTGVSQRQSKWIAYINVAKKRYFLGSYDDIEDAIAARKQAENEWKDKLLGFQE